MPKRAFDLLMEIAGDHVCATAYASDVVSAIAEVKSQHERHALHPWSAVTIVAVLPQRAAETLKGAVRDSIWTPKEGQ